MIFMHLILNSIDLQLTNSGRFFRVPQMTSYLFYSLMTKRPVISFLILLCLVSITLQQCQPNYPRMFWNPNANEINTHTIDMIFMFNTNVSCPYSYVQVFDHSSIYKFRCSENKIQTKFDDGTVQFVNYVQKCFVYVAKDSEINSFRYVIYGSKFISIDNVGAEPSEQFLVEYPTNDLPLRFAVISDWGPIIIKPYKPLNDTLDYILEKRVKERESGSGNEWRINGLFLNGDYAYDLETDNCQMYLLFLKQTSRISRFWPILTTVGNHESMRPKSMYLFENSFIIGRLTTADKVYERVQSYRFANRTTFLFFDPFLEIYNISSPQNYSIMKNSIQKHLIEARQGYPDEFTIMASHYPVMCSQVDPHCRDAMGNMPDLYEWLSTPYKGKGLVDLYIGSHMHQYERIWPFVNNKFVNESSPYYRGRLANFVQAVGGVNYFIIEEYYKPEYFSVYSTYNLTGMGIMTISGNSTNKKDTFQIHYKHIITPNTYEEVDEFIVTNKFKEDSTNNLSIMTEQTS